MSILSLSTPISSHAVGGIFDPVGVAVRAPQRRVWRIRLANALARRHQRQALADLEPRLLADIGISHAAAQREAAKPFWK